MVSAPLPRPTFTVPLARPRDEAVEALRAALMARPELAGRWRGKGRWAELYVPEAERRTWSPYLSIRVDEHGDGSTLLGRFAPHPEVWTFFMFLYFLVAFVTLFGATLAYVQWVSGEAAWGLWTVWVGLPCLVLIHLASALGARLGRPQMVALREELDRVLDDTPGLRADG